MYLPSARARQAQRLEDSYNHLEEENEEEHHKVEWTVTPETYKGHSITNCCYRRHNFHWNGKNNKLK